MDEQFQPAKNEATKLTVRDLFYKYARFLPLFVISIAICLFGAYIYLRYATLVYRATGTMIIQDDKAGSNSSNDEFKQIFGSDNKKNIQNEIEYIQSRPMMNRVVNALDLNFTYIAKGQIKVLDIYKSSPFIIEAFMINDSSRGFTLNIDFQNDHDFRVNNEDGTLTFGQTFKNANGVFRLTRNNIGVLARNYKVIWDPTSAVASRFLSSLTVTQKQNTGILTLALESDNPELAADVINRLMMEYQNATIEDKNSATQKKLEFIDKESDIVARQLDTITGRKIAFIKQNNLVDTKTQTSNFLSRIEETNKDMKVQQLQLSNAYQIENYVHERNSSALVPSSLSLGDPTLNAMVSAYNQAQIDKSNLLQNAPPGNIAVQQKSELVEKLRQNILENIKNIKQSYGNAIGSLQKDIGSATSQIKLMPEKQQFLEEIDRQLAGKLDVYKSLLVEREKSAMSLASTISDIKVLQDALPNYAPVQPNNRNIKLLSILVGVILPSLFIFILEVLNDKVTTRFDIEKITPTTILGEVGHAFGKGALVVTNNNRGVVAEQFRILRSNLQYVLNNIQRPVILVTSSFSGEGKSFISTNIGAVMALAGKKTIILEFDIRKPKILSHLDIQKKPGLTNYLLGKIPIESLPIPVPGADNLYVLGCGPVPPNPAELLLDTKLNDLFAYLRENFDAVIMDTAPVGMVSDAMSLSKFADATLYIVRQGHTFKKQVNLIDEFYRESKLPKMAIILNDVKLRTGYGYYGYGRYGYGYGYGSGYFDDDKDMPRSSFFGKWFGWFDLKKSNRKKLKRTKS